MFDEITTEREPVKTTKPSRRVALEGTKVLVDPATGEEFRVGHMAVTDADANFSKIWLANLLLAVEEFGSASMAVLFWLVKKTEETRGNNTIYMTIREIAAEVGKSTQTVHKVLRILETHDIIRRKTGVIFVSPEVIYKGTHTGRMHVLTTYKAVEKADLEEDDVRARVERRAQELKRISEQYDYVRKLMEADLDALEREADAAAE
ncbi:MAG: replication/maintenance protein RepL [Planctomycetes bacterium]|nr:replication/maintenance protein RepL [Planctomycetota bacterium]